jgi:hypothetical protein
MPVHYCSPLSYNLLKLNFFINFNIVFLTRLFYTIYNRSTSLLSYFAL